MTLEGMDEVQGRERVPVGRAFLRRQMGGPTTLEKSAGKLKGLSCTVRQADGIV